MWDQMNNFIKRVAKNVLAESKGKDIQTKKLGGGTIRYKRQLK